MITIIKTAWTKTDLMTGMHASHAERKDELHAFPSLSLQEEEIIPENPTAK
jgi:hypothetical protein